MGGVPTLKYLEELSNGDSFSVDDKIYIISADYRIKKGNTQRECIEIASGNKRWFEGGEIVNLEPIYTLDVENNIIPIKPTEKQDV